MAKMEPYPIDDLRRDMLVKLATPDGRRIVRALAKAEGFAEFWRGELVGLLTESIQEARIERPAPSRKPGSFA